jgi:hypothetical protein
MHVMLRLNLARAERLVQPLVNQPVDGARRLLTVDAGRARVASRFAPLTAAKIAAHNLEI